MFFVSEFGAYTACTNSRPGSVSSLNSHTEFICTGIENSVADVISGTENTLVYTSWTSATSAGTNLIS